MPLLGILLNEILLCYTIISMVLKHENPLSRQTRRVMANLRVRYIVRVSNTIHASLRQFPSIKNTMLNLQEVGRPSHTTIQISF